MRGLATVRGIEANPLDEVDEGDDAYPAALLRVRIPVDTTCALAIFQVLGSPSVLALQVRAAHHRGDRRALQSREEHGIPNGPTDLPQVQIKRWIRTEDL